MPATDQRRLIFTGNYYSKKLFLLNILKTIPGPEEKCARNSESGGNKRTLTMRKFLIAGHGTVASGFKSSLDLITGANENIYVINAYVEENKSAEDEIKEIGRHLTPEDELIIFTDLLGGSITNQVLQFAFTERVHVIAGVNLPLLIDVILADPLENAETVIATAVQNAREQLVYVNPLMKNTNPETEYD